MSPAGPVLASRSRPGAATRPRRTRPAFDLIGSATCDRITLIEFVWVSRDGSTIQPVLYLERRLLQ